MGFKRLMLLAKCSINEGMAIADDWVLLYMCKFPYGILQ